MLLHIQLISALLALICTAEGTNNTTADWSIDTRAEQYRKYQQAKIYLGTLCEQTAHCHASLECIDQYCSCPYPTVFDYDLSGCRPMVCEEYCWNRVSGCDPFLCPFCWDLDTFVCRLTPAQQIYVDQKSRYANRLVPFVAVFGMFLSSAGLMVVVWRYAVKSRLQELRGLAARHREAEAAREEVLAMQPRVTAARDEPPKYSSLDGTERTVRIVDERQKPPSRSSPLDCEVPPPTYAEIMTEKPANQSNG